MKTFFSILLLIAPTLVQAQFLNQGSIDFTRTTNPRITMQLEAPPSLRESSFFKDVLKQLPKKLTTEFKMSFNEKGSSYFFDKEGPDKMSVSFGGPEPASENIVIKDLTKNSISSHKIVFENDYIINDTIKKWSWKIHDEVRTIAGYPCRKATTTFNDSVVVVAFYTDRIIPSLGPESVGGLPGMILGLAVPRLYTSWYATKVYEAEIPPAEVKKMKKGTPINNEKLFKDLEKTLKSWDNYGDNIIWRIMI